MRMFPLVRNFLAGLIDYLDRVLFHQSRTERQEHGRVATATVVTRSNWLYIAGGKMTRTNGLCRFRYAGRT